MDIAVLGGGNGSYAAAADLTDRGFRVRLWRRDAEALAALHVDRTLELIDCRGPRRVTLAAVCDSLAAAIDGVELIVAPLPATAHVSLAAALTPHLHDGQVLLVTPGTFGSYVIARALRAHGSTAAVAIAESGTLPYLARKRGPTTVAVSARAARLPVGVFPARLSPAALATVARAYPEVEPRRDALDAALLNAGPVIHPPLILMNAGPLATNDGFDIHAEGTQLAIRRVQDALDGERLALREALGYGPPHFPLRDYYEPGGDEWMYGDRARTQLAGTDDWREPIDLRSHRYMREDVACGLALLVSAAAWAGMPCPVATGLLAVASAVVGEELRDGERTFDALGLAKHDAAALASLLVKGPAAG